MLRCLNKACIDELVNDAQRIGLETVPVRNLKESHEKLRDQGYLTGQGNDEIEELENVPAYVRKNIPIDQEKHSEDQEVSRYRLTDEDEGEEGPKLKSDNTQSPA